MYERISEWLRERNFKFSEFYDISRQSSIRAGCKVRLFVTPRSLERLSELLVHLESEGARYTVIGGATNTLFAGRMYGDPIGTQFAGRIYDGVAVSTKEICSICNNGEIFTAECGASIAKVMRAARYLGYGGYEQLSLIPGTVGGAVRGNAGAHGASLSDITVGGSVLSVKDGSVFYLSGDELDFSYRTSRIKKKAGEILLSADLKLKEMDIDEMICRRKAYLDARRATQPIGEYSLGSVFKKVSGVSAGYYIDKAGLKGLSVGGASVSEKHAGFIVNKGGAVGDDILRLIELVEDRVYGKFGITLEREIEVIE